MSTVGFIIRRAYLAEKMFKLFGSFLLCSWTVVGLMDPPTWPQGYSYECTIKNKDDFEQTVKYYVSLGSLRIREDIDAATNTNFLQGYDGWKTKRWSYFPTTNTSTGEYDVTKCYYSDVTSQGAEALPILPDMSEFYKYVGNESFRGVETQRWEQHFSGSHQTIWITHGQSNNTMYPIPVSSEIKAYGGHDDSILTIHTYIDYYNYVPEEPHSSVWSEHANVSCTLMPGEQPHMHPSHSKGHVQSKAELVTRRESFLKSKSLVETHNQRNSTYKLELNKFAHMTDDELIMYTSGYKGKVPEYIDPFPYSDLEIRSLFEDLPDSLDWRIHGAVTHVRDQEKCGSCWAFATVGALEGAHFLKSQSLEVLSEQALVDCSWGAGNYGCTGGLANNALRWVQEAHGIPTAAGYGPYSAINGHCRFNKTKLIADVKSFKQVKPAVEALKVALIHHGPIAVAIDAGDAKRRQFSMYSHGVFKPDSWSEDVNHAVLLVGYGNLDGEPYWLVKNSWGQEWGMNGFGLISAQNNTLNLLNHAWYSEL